ncbi:hypothetical protein ACQUJT_20735 [Ralstonia pseudosolanacearum]
MLIGSPAPIQMLHQFLLEEISNGIFEKNETESRRPSILMNIGFINLILDLVVKITQTTRKVSNEGAIGVFGISLGMVEPDLQTTRGSLFRCISKSKESVMRGGVRS